MSESYKDSEVSYQEAVNAYLEFMHRTDMKAYTFDPVSRMGFCVGTKEDAKIMHDRYSNGIDPLYVIGVTNHIGMPDDEMESAYSGLLEQKIHPFFGRWTAGNIEFTDISYAINHGIDESKIMELKMQYAQKSILRINRNGNITYV